MLPWADLSIMRAARCKGSQVPQRIRRSGGLWSSVRKLNRNAHALLRNEHLLHSFQHFQSGILHAECA